MNRATSIAALLAFAPSIGSCGAKTGLEITPYREVFAAHFPRPIAPLSLSDVSLLRPTLRWQLPSGFDGAEVELCLDRECTRLIETLRVLGTSVRPTMDLPARTVVFWRLRGTAGSTIDPRRSPTWLFHVPARDNSGAVDTSSNPHLDLNGDGFDDVVVGARSASPRGRQQAGTVNVYYGGNAGIAATPSIILEGPTPYVAFGSSVASAGDVNGDGFGDLVVGAPTPIRGGELRGGAHTGIYHGSAVGIDREPSQVLRPDPDRDGFGEQVSGAGDVNGDGYADVLIATGAVAPGGTSTPAKASVFHGGPNGTETTPARVIEGFRYDDLGHGTAGAGDLNGDGFSDIAVGSLRSTGTYNIGHVNVFHGGAAGIPRTATRVLETTTLAHFGTAVASAGDVNGDGFGDLIVGAYQDSFRMPMAGSVHIFSGSRMGVQTSAAQILRGTREAEWFGFSVSSAGDVNGDGFADIIIGAVGAAPRGQMFAGTATLFHGSVTGIGTTSERILEGAQATDYFGWSVAGAGDVNGDGYSDVIVGASKGDFWSSIGAGTATIWHGAVTGVARDPARVLVGQPSEQFGQVVASWSEGQQSPWVGQNLGVMGRSNTGQFSGHYSQLLADAMLGSSNANVAQYSF